MLFDLSTSWPSGRGLTPASALQYVPPEIGGASFSSHTWRNPFTYCPPFCQSVHVVNYTKNLEVATHKLTIYKLLLTASTIGGNILTFF